MHVETVGFARGELATLALFEVVCRLVAISVLPVWCVVLGVGDGHGLQREPEVPDAGEQTVQLRVVDDVADEFGGIGAWHERHPVEGCAEACAEALAYGDPDAECGFHDERRIGPACVSAHHPGAVSRRVIGVDDEAELESDAGRRPSAR